MGIFIGICIAVAAFWLVGRHVTYQSCRAYVYIKVYEDSYDQVKANFAAAGLTWALCLQLNAEMNGHAASEGGQPAMRRHARSLGWSG